MNDSIRVLPLIVVAQFMCTSLWFAGNAVLPALSVNYGLDTTAVASVTSSVQFGFITGTLIFAALSIADRYSPSRVFMVSAVLGSLFNVGVTWSGNTLTSILIFRFLTGFFLAGIYPVGMKIAADYFQKGLGKSLGFLVGALVFGTAFPHLLSDLTKSLPWESVAIGTSSIAAIGGMVLGLLVPDGPHRKPSQKLQLTAIITIFRNKPFRAAAGGYFGHMWELYTFWAFVPSILLAFQNNQPMIDLNIPLISFFVIAVGGVACIIGGYASQSIGTRKTAFLLLLASGICCLISPLFLSQSSLTVLLIFLLFWGMVVMGDSPLFSTLVAQNATVELKGSALTIVNCIGFSITIISIQLMSYLSSMYELTYLFMILAIGPLLGLIALSTSRKA